MLAHQEGVKLLKCLKSVLKVCIYRHWSVAPSFLHSTYIIQKQSRLHERRAYGDEWWIIFFFFLHIKGLIDLIIVGLFVLDLGKHHLLRAG